MSPDPLRGKRAGGPMEADAGRAYPKRTRLTEDIEHQ